MLQIFARDEISNLDRIQLSSASLLSLIAPPAPHETKLRKLPLVCRQLVA